MPGTWNTREIRGLGPKSGAEKSMFSIVREFVADATNAGVPTWEIKDANPAFLADVGVLFDSVVPPDGVILTIKDIDDLQIHQETFSASGRVVITDRPSVVGGCTVSVSGNSVNGAKAKVILNFANNLR